MKPLRIGILAGLESPTISKFLAPTLRDRGHNIDVLDVSHVPEDGFAEHPDIQALTSYNLLYYRSGLDQDAYVTKILLLEAVLRESSVETVNLNFTTHPQAHAKSHEIRVGGDNGLPIPETVYEPNADFEHLRAALGVPFVSKTDFGTNGLGVHLITTAEELAVVQAESGTRNLIHQAYVPHDFEYRVYLVGGEVIFITKKAPPEGDFRTNEAQGGGTLTPEAEHTEDLTRLGRLADQTFGFEIFVADFMLRKDTGTFVFTEVNLNPGWGATDLAATGVDAIGLMADYFERRCT